VATVTIPLLLKEVTGGVRRAEVPGSTLAEVLRALEGVFPGIEVRIASGGRLDPNLLVAVDGVLAAEGLATPVRPESEVSILPTFGGG
jgi:molybdopterin converting factor small subunit